MTGAFIEKINPDLNKNPLARFFKAIEGYNDESEYAPVEEIQSLRGLNQITVKDFEQIHNALLIAYDVPHPRKPDLRPAIISSVRLLAINNSAPYHVINVNRLKKWVEIGLNIIDDQSVHPNEYLLSAAIALVRDQWEKVPLAQRNKNQVNFSTDISSCIQDKKEKVIDDPQARVLEKCIDWMDSSSLFVCSAATSLLSKQWLALSDEQQNTVIVKSIENLDAMNTRSVASLLLLDKQWLALSDEQQNTVIVKSIENLDAMNTRSVASLLLLDKQWLALSDEQQEAVITKSIDLVDADPEVSCEAISLISHHLPMNDRRNCVVANESKLILEKSDNTSQRLAAAQYAKKYIEASSVPAEIKEMFLMNFLRVSRNSNEVAIFTEALQTLEAQAGGTTYSQTPIASPSTNGHRLARAAQTHQPATNPAALERAALARPSR
jgi:hypothetical protein